MDGKLGLGLGLGVALWTSLMLTSGNVGHW
jgi:hypothetical protein